MSSSEGSFESPHTYEYLWAKQSGLTGTYPLAAHLLDAASVAYALFHTWLRPGLREIFESELGPEAARTAAYLVGIHDVGKANPYFQWQPKQRGAQWDEIRARIKESGQVRVPTPKQQEEWVRNQDFNRHERVTALHLDEDIDLRSLGEAWSIIPGLGHHGYFSVPFVQNNGGPRAKGTAHDFLHQRGWDEARDGLAAEVATATGCDPGELPESCSPKISLLLSGLTVLADRLASSEKWVLRSQEDMASGTLNLAQPRVWFDRQTEQARAYVEQNVGVYHGWPDYAEATRDILAGRDPRPMQKEVSRAGEGMVTVMAPTGSGKTEAALLRHAQRDERLIFLLPTQATTNALMRRVQRAFQNTPNVASLAHGMASVEDFYNTPVTVFDDRHESSDSCQEPGGLFPRSFVRGGMSRLLASVCVGTVDQALKAGLRAKWVHLLLLALANAHVVIDEVHTLDRYQTELLKTVLTWLGALGTRVTLLTATFPSWQYAALYRTYAGEEPSSGASFPAITDTTGAQSAFEVQPHGIAIEYVKLPEHSVSTVEAHVDWVREKRQAFPDARIGVICNRVRWAQETALALQAEGHDVIVLHASMTSGHRQKNAALLEELLGPEGAGKGVTVIGTQAIEASLDIDLDLLSTDLCPSASLIQRAGRVWRRPDDARARRVPGINQKTMRVVDAVATNEHARCPYWLAELQRTARWLQEHRELAVPGDCQEFVDASTVTWEEVVTSATEAEKNQYAGENHKTKRGQDYSYNMRELLDTETSVRTLEKFLGKDSIGSADFDQLHTRDIERDKGEQSVPVLIATSADDIPGAWRGDARQLRSIQPGEKDKIRSALTAAMPLRERHATKIEERLEDLSDSPTLLSRYRLLHVGGLYHPLVGFLGWSVGQHDDSEG